MSVKGFLINGVQQKYDFNSLDNKPEVFGGGQPIPVSSASEMADRSSMYVYFGDESGYSYGYIYAYLDDTWMATELYGKGSKGDKGDKGDAFTYDDFTPEQLEGLIGPPGPKGDDGTATDQQVNNSVTAWLNAHPEATTTVEDGAISAEKLSDSLAETLGVVKQAKDRSVDLREMNTAQPAKWSSGGVTYPSSSCNCIEFKFTVADIIDQLPEGLTQGINLLLFGAASGYKTRMHFVGTVDGTATTTKPDTYNLRTTLRIVPAFENLTTVYIYVYSDTITAPTVSDVETFRENLIASAVDMLCGKSYYFDQWLTSAIAVSPSDPINMRLFNWDDDIYVKTVLNYARGQITASSGSLSSGAFRFFDADFTSLRYVNPGILNARDAYVTWTMGGESFCGDWGENSFDWGDVKFILPH